MTGNRVLGYLLVGLFFAVLFAVIRRLTRGPEPNSHPAGENFEARAGAQHLDR
jgi:hypothetical protein